LEDEGEMNSLWQRFLAVLRPGTRLMLALLAMFYLAALAGNLSGTVDLYAWLTLNGLDFWRGQVWRLMTYALLPAGMTDFLVNGIALVLLGCLLERHWSRSEFWVYCAFAVAGAGMAKVGLQFSSPGPLAGTAPMMFGLLAAWAFVCGRETVLLFPIGEVTVWKVALVAGAAGLVATVFTVGVVAAVIMAAGGAAGWAQLWVKHKWLMSRAARVARSERIQRLEL
jgi:membrane associated rhomboid family serine protease